MRALRFVANPDNPGFAVACNQGARVTSPTAPWLAFVNPGLPGRSRTRWRACARMRRQLDGNALLGADLVDEDGVRDAAARRRDPDFAAMLRMRRAAGARSACRSTTRKLAAAGRRGLRRADAAAARLFERIGGFDEGYRLHAEDLDLCRRARDAGAVVAVANDVRVRARARRVVALAAAVRGMAQASRPVALLPQVRGAATRPASRAARCSR